MSPQGETIVQQIGSSLSNQVLDVQRLGNDGGERGKLSTMNSQARIAATGSRAARMSKDVDVNP